MLKVLDKNLYAKTCWRQTVSVKINQSGRDGSLLGQNYEPKYLSHQIQKKLRASNNK